MKNKQGFLMRDLVIAAVLFSGIMALFVVIMGAMAYNYDRDDLVSDSFSNNFDKLNDLTGQVNNQYLSVSNKNGTGLQLEGAFDVMFGSSWGVIGLIFSTVDTYANLGTSIISEFTFIPQSVLYLLSIILLTALSVYIIFSVISSLLRGKL